MATLAYSQLPFAKTPQLNLPTLGGVRRKEKIGTSEENRQEDN